MTVHLEVPPEFQSNFPYKDISQEMAETLEGILVDPVIINDGHIAAENNSYLYAVGHFQFYHAIASQMSDVDRLDAFSDGLGLYELTSAFMRQQPDRVNELIAQHNITELRRTLESDSGLWTVSEAKDEFTAKLPRAAHAIGQSAVHFHGRYAEYAIGGAAISWLAERNANDDIRSLDF